MYIGIGVVVIVVCLALARLAVADMPCDDRWD
jgi:hypothetical protein